MSWVLKWKLRPELKTELVAGFTTFLTTAYIVVVNPSILAHTGMPFSAALTATVLLCFSMTLLMGLYAKLPYVVAPGMGINAYFTYSLVLGKGVPWMTALGMIFWAGVIFLILSVLPVREKIARAVPAGLRHAAAVGIGLFLTLIGLKNMGLITADPVTMVRMGPLNRQTLASLFSLLLMVILIRRKNPFAFLAGIGAGTLTGWFLGIIHIPSSVTNASLISAPDFSLFGQLDIWGALKLSMLPAIIGICFTDLFDSLSTFVGVSQACGLVDARGEPKNLKQGLVVDSIATLTAGLFGTSSGTAYIESLAGIEVGGRTGMTAVVAALCFLPCLFLGPAVGIVPPFATAPALVLVGSSMFRSVRSIPMDAWEDLIPSFFTIVLIPLTFSITQGILWGFVSMCCCYTVAGRFRELKPSLVFLSLLSVFLLWIEQIS